MDIKDKVERLINTYGTNNPFKLCKYFKINIIYMDLGNIKGYSIKKMKKKVICINSNLSDFDKKLVCAHELGHCFSPNQQENSGTGRKISEEVDSDTFAVKYCDISPHILERALAKSFEYEMKDIGRKKDVTQERVDRYIEEMKARKRNIEKLIREIEEQER